MAVGTTIFFAGGEVGALTKALLENGVRNILYSYYYILTLRREAFIERMMDAYPEVNWFLDSGAFTYFQMYQSNPDRLPPLRQYIRRYFAYIDTYGERYCRITEPDMDIASETEEQVDEWREEMLDRWPHLNITPVWHNHRGQDAWYRYCVDQRIKTLAIGSGDVGTDYGLARRMIALAAQNGKPVHGFGLTRIATMLRYVPFDSVDSISWVMGQKVGTTFIFKDNHFRRIPLERKKQRKLYKTYFKNIGCDPKLVLDDHGPEVRKANIIAWRALADRLETIKRRNRQTYGIDNIVLSASPIGYDLPGGRTRPLGHGEMRVSNAGTAESGKPVETQQVRAPSGEKNPKLRPIRDLFGGTSKESGDVLRKPQELQADSATGRIRVERRSKESPLAEDVDDQLFDDDE